MRGLIIGMASIDTTVGATESNTVKAIERADQLAEKGCDIVLFQEQTIPGYPVEDLVQWRSFVEAQWDALLQFTNDTENLKPIFVIGLTVAIRAADASKLYNVAAVVHGGTIYGLVPKELLPTYNVFYEARTFARGHAGLFEVIEAGSDEEALSYDIPFGDLVFRGDDFTFGVEICEDIWSADGPQRRRAYAGAELMLNMSASPHRAGVQATRREMIATRASDNAVIVAYLGAVGANDGLVFDGPSFVNVCGTPVFEGPRWKEGNHVVHVDLDEVTRARTENTTRRLNSDAFLMNQRPEDRSRVIVIPVERHNRVLDVPRSHGSKGPCSYFLPASTPPPARSEYDEYLNDLLEGAIMGLDGYFRKTGAFDCVGIALSGGRDSGLTAAIARIWVDRRFANESEDVRVQKRRELLHFISMPTRFNSAQTKNMARSIADELGATFYERPIEAAFQHECDELRETLGVPELPPLVMQNIQARIRGMRMWSWSSGTRGLWLQTGNMSETATGYTTIGGDLMGAFSLIGNIPKTVVIHLLRYIARTYGFTSIAKQAEVVSSAELASGQSDEKDLMPFEILDACFALFAGKKMSPREMYITLMRTWTFDDLVGLDPSYTPGQLKEWVRKFCKLFMINIFKWVQKPLGVHHGSLDLDRERALQIPVVTSLEWLDLDNAFDDLPDV